MYFFEILTKFKELLGWATALVTGLLATSGNFPQF